MKKLKKIDLLLKEIKDPHAQENFWRLKNFLENLELNGLTGGNIPGPPGPPGAPGADGASSNVFVLTAGETLSALKFVYIGPDGFAYLGNSTVFNSSEVIGMTTTAANAGNSVSIQPFGVASDASFTFGYSQMLFLTTLGNFSTTVPVVGHRVKLGQGLNNGKIFIDIDETIIL